MVGYWELQQKRKKTIGISPRPAPIAMDGHPGSAGPVAVVRGRSESSLVHGPVNCLNQGYRRNLHDDPRSTFVHGRVYPMRNPGRPHVESPAWYVIILVLGLLSSASQSFLSWYETVMMSSLFFSGSFS